MCDVPDSMTSSANVVYSGSQRLCISAPAFR